MLNDCVILILALTALTDYDRLFESTSWYLTYSLSLFLFAVSFLHLRFPPFPDGC